MAGFLRYLLPGLLGLALMAGLGGCGDKQETSETPAAAAPVASDDKAEEPGPAGEAAEIGEAAQEIPALEAKPAADEPASAGPAGDGPVASVNGVEISRRVYNREVALEKEFAQIVKQRDSETAGAAEPRKNAFEQDALSTLINFELAYQESQRLALHPVEEEIEQTLSLMKANYLDESKFEAALKENSMTVAELKEQIRRSLAIKMWQEQEFVDKITISDEAAEKVYREQPQLFIRPESIMVSHILINWPEGGDPKAAKEEARLKIAEIREKALADGADFSSLAKETSADPTVKDNGGNLGWITRGITVEPFEKVAFALEKPGQISEILETPFGFHIIRLEDKQPAGTEPFEDVKEWLKASLAEEEIEKAVQKRLAALKSQADIKIIDSSLNTAGGAE